MSKFNNEKGQALFEMIIFMPFLMFLYTIFGTIGNSLSSSINQQKAVRGYFYQTVKGNSYITSSADINYLGSKGRTSIGFYAIGWDEKIPGDSPYGNCFEFSSTLKNGSTEVCDDNKGDKPENSIFVRSFTAYGVCGPIFEIDNGQPKKFKIEQPAQLGQCALI